MRYQDRIYIQNAHTCVRNKDHINVNMSSDICNFVSPIFGMTGADKIMTGTTSSDHNIHIIDSGTTIDRTFTFTGNVETSIYVETTFKYEIYKYNNASSVFVTPYLVASDDIEYNSFSATSAFTDTIIIDDLNIDGEYLVKGSYDFKICTNILNKLGDIVDTNVPLVGTSYGLYTEEYDYYFVAIQNASTPLFTLSQADDRLLGALVVESFFLSGETIIESSSTWSGNVIVALNGLTLSEGDDEDFTTTDNNFILLNGTTVNGDILTISYISSGNPNGLLAESILAPTPIVSGATDGEGSNNVYFNTGTTLYEVYLLATPLEFNDVIVTLNGVTLANGADYNQSNINPLRIILNGVIIPDDIITLTYNSYGTYVGTINVDMFTINWTISPAPTNINGSFITLAAEDDTFNDVIFSSVTPYISNETTYETTIDLSAYTGTTAVYKVTNQKDYLLISGDTISSFTDSEVIPITIDL